MKEGCQMEHLYSERLNRYVTTLRNGKADCIPIRPFVAEFAAKYAGFTCQEVTHDFEKALEAVRVCATEFDWDAVVGNMVYVWTGLTQSIGLTYYGVPGIDIPPDVGFQYREPPEDKSWMRPDEYDDLIADPTGFLLNVWLPRVSTEVQAPGQVNTARNNLSFLKGGMAMMNYFTALGTQSTRLREECGTVSAIAGILKAPMDILADKLRGYLGLISDLRERPEKVLAACEALRPHLLQVALGGADPEKNVPISIWMHRGCVPFVSFKHFDEIYWKTLRPIIEGIWAQGHQTLFYAEGNWDLHLSAFSELPDHSIVYHVDRGDIVNVHKQIGHKFCLSGGLPNDRISFGTPSEIRDCCKRIIDEVAADGGYIMDASAIIQNDAKIENIRAMTEFTREYGVYPDNQPYEPFRSTGNAEDLEEEPSPEEPQQAGPKPGVCFPWEEKAKELPEISGDRDLVRRIWEQNEGLAYLYVWHCLLSF